MDNGDYYENGHLGKSRYLLSFSSDKPTARDSGYDRANQCSAIRCLYPRDAFLAPLPPDNAAFYGEAANFATTLRRDVVGHSNVVSTTVNNEARREKTV